MLAATVAVAAAAALIACQRSESPAANEIALTADMKRDVGAAIRDNGFNCPEPKMAFAQGQDTRGSVIKLYCGPAGQSGVYQNAVFRITFTPNDLMLIQPW